jgi:hypothetical protein
MFWISPPDTGRMKDAFMQNHERRFKKITNADHTRLTTQADHTRNHVRVQTHRFGQDT